MFVRSIELKNFRCFASQTITFERPIILIEGCNGSGKTSLLEALHYGCYLRSFRTYNPGHLIAHGQESFFIKLNVSENEEDHMSHQLHVGFAGKRRSVKLNERSISSFKELMDSYRVITVTEDDLELVTGGPEKRRTFLDQAIMLSNPLFAKILAQLRRIIDQRSSLLARGKPQQEVYYLWTQQLWQKSREVIQERMLRLGSILQESQELITQMFEGAYRLDMTYSPKMELEALSFDEWLAAHPLLYESETNMGRSLFGAHLDDVIIRFQDNHSKLYASRGQQKLLVMLIKMAQVKEITRNRGSVVLLLDDFLTDFDQIRAQKCLQTLMGLQGGQLILTTPLAAEFLVGMIDSYGGQRVSLTG